MQLLQEYGHHIVEVFPHLMKGVVLTLKITGLSVLFGIFIGLFVSLAKLSHRKFLNFLAVMYIDCVRGTPLLVQILLIYFGIPRLLSQMTGNICNLSAVTAGIIACSINSGAYVAEIFRAGIQSIDKGQMEAARSLGMSHVQSMCFVILPQAFRRVIPPLGNEFIVLLKDSSLLCMIGVPELMQEGKLYAASNYAYFPTYLAIAMVYLILTFSISRGFALIERRLSASDSR